MTQVTLIIDGLPVKARAGEKVLWAALDNGIYIPNLCAIRERPEPDAGCRLCWVEVMGLKEPVPACALEVADGMVVTTAGPKALTLARAAFSLIMASHDLDCAHCKADGRCELQTIAKTLGVSLKPKQLRKLVRGLPVDDSHPLIKITPDKCVLCGRCVWECRKHGQFSHSKLGSVILSGPHYSRNPSRDGGDACSCKARDARPTKAYSMQYVEEEELAQRSKCRQIRRRSRIS